MPRRAEAWSANRCESTNVGFRLLRITARVEPATCSTIQIASELATHPFLTIDQTDIPVAIELPVNAGSADLGTVVIESNGGTRRVKVLLERPVAQVANFEDTSGEGSAELVFNTRPLGELITAQPIARRLILVPLGLLAFRLLVLLAGWIPLESSAGGRLEPRLASIALVLAAAGAVWGGWRGGMSGDRFACGFAAAMAGVLTAAVGFAFVRSVESLLGDGPVRHRLCCCFGPSWVLRSPCYPGWPCRHRDLSRLLRWSPRYEHCSAPERAACTGDRAAVDCGTGTCRAG